MVNEGINKNQEAFRKRFRRSGSLGIPFIPDDEIENIKEFWTNGEHDDGPKLLTLIIGFHKESDGLLKIMQIFQKFHLNFEHIESRETHERSDIEKEILIQLMPDKLSQITEAVEELKLASLQVATLKSNVQNLKKQDIYDEKTVNGTKIEFYNKKLMSDDKFADVAEKVVWFPRNIYDLDITAKRVLMYGSELDADHPGFKDEIYRERRMFFADIALNYKHGEPIPRVQYSKQETTTWGTVFRELRQLHVKHACREYLENFTLLQKYCGYSEQQIPQLDDISKFLKAKTGFQVRPVAGYLSSRDFLGGLAFRVFHCTQYIRHPIDPFYSPEPDCCHELLGHMPLFADPDFAQFSHEIGLASLGASDEDILQLATLYFFSIEFGLCREGGQLKIYGAGLLSSIAELKHAVGDGNSKIAPFDPELVVQQKCLITSFQDAYFVSENFEEAQQKLRVFTAHMKRPFVVRYNPYTESIEVLNNKRSLTMTVNSLRSDINLLTAALHTIL